MKKTMRVCGISLLLLLAGCAATHGSRTAALSPSRAAAVDAAVESAMRGDGVVGMAVGVIEHDEIVYLKGYGYADREKRLPVTAQTMFRWASVSKPVTAIAALQLVERGKLDLDADVRTYVPEFPDKGVKITTRDLLRHQGGIVHYDNGAVIRTEKKYAEAHPYADVVVALDTFKDSPLVNAPGAKYSYSTHGYLLVSAVVQRAGGAPFAQQVRERIAEPLHLTTMQPDYQWLEIPNRAVGYRKDGDAVVPSTDTDVSWKLGGGGYISDIGDFAGFAKGLIDGRLVSAQTAAAMWTPQNLRNGEPTGYGLGFGVGGAEQGGRLRIAHNGSQEKTKTRLEIYPRERRGVVVMTNSEWAEPEKFTTAVLAALGEAKAAN